MVQLAGACGSSVTEDGAFAIRDGLHQFVGWRDGRTSNVLVVKVYGVAEAVVVGGLNMTPMRSVVLGRSAEIPAVHRVEGPGASFICFFMNLNIASHWCKWHFVVIEWSI